jgi:hypothetical protein
MPAMIAPTPRLLSAVASSWTRALWVACIAYCPNAAPPCHRSRALKCTDPHHHARSIDLGRLATFRIKGASLGGPRTAVTPPNALNSAGPIRAGGSSGRGRCHQSPQLAPSVGWSARYFSWRLQLKGSLD